MEMDYGKVNDAVNLPDEQFASLIYAVVLASGGSQAQALAAKSNVYRIKRKLVDASEEDLRQLAGTLDPALLQGIMTALKAKEGQGG